MGKTASYELTPVGALGVGLLQAWFLCAFYSPMFSFETTLGSAGVSLCFLVWLITQIAILFLFSFKPQAARLIALSNVCVTVSAVLGSAGTLLLALAPLQNVAPALPAALLGAALMAYSTCIFHISWIFSYCNMPVSSSRAACALFPAVAAIVFLSVQAIPGTGVSPTPALVLTALFPLISLALLKFAENKSRVVAPRPEEADASGKPGAPWWPSASLLICILVFAVCAQGFPAGLGVYNQNANGSLTIELLFSSFVILSIFLPYSKSETNVLHAAILMLIIGAGTLALGIEVVGVTCLGGGWMCFEVLMWITIVRISRTLRGSTFLIISKTFLICEFGNLVGVLVGLAVGMVSRPPSLLASGIVLLFALAGVIALIVVVKQPFLDNDGHEDDQNQVPNNSYDLKCAAAVRQYGLTPRESEVLMLLAYGRDITAIQEMLCISLNTAKTHIRHIYQKFGVSGKQALLDVINSIEID